MSDQTVTGATAVKTIIELQKWLRVPNTAVRIRVVDDRKDAPGQWVVDVQWGDYCIAVPLRPHPSMKVVHGIQRIILFGIIRTAEAHGAHRKLVPTP